MRRPGPSSPWAGPGESAIAAAEERLGRRLPPSYREFLAVSDGWRVEQTAGIYQLGGAADIEWFRDPFDVTPLSARRTPNRKANGTRWRLCTPIGLSLPRFALTQAYACFGSVRHRT